MASDRPSLRRAASGFAGRTRFRAGVLAGRIAARRLAGQRLLRRLVRVTPRGVFVVVGANDGQQDEQFGVLHAARGWSGVLVEPHPQAFARLSDRFAGSERIRLANVAIAESDGTRPFYGIEPPASPADAELFGSYDLIASLSRETIVSHGWLEDAERRVTSTEVECLRFDSLRERYGLDRVDCLLIDAEGYDLRILETVDLERQRPRLIAYEHLHLGDAARARARELLAEAGYATLEEGYDTWCLDRTPPDSLSALWPRLKARREAMTSATAAAPSKATRSGSR